MKLKDDQKTDLINRIDRSLKKEGLNPRVTCPTDPKWLSAMSRIFPKDIFCESKLGKYGECLEKNPCEY